MLQSAMKSKGEKWTISVDGFLNCLENIENKGK